MRIKIFSRPTDRSLPAFKDWLQSMTTPFNPNAPATLRTKLWISEEGWVANWKAFWARADDTPKPQSPREGQ